jgi:membrane-bound serine protease (ClpP class)
MIAAALSAFVLYAEFTGSVNPGSAAHLIDAIHSAQAQGAEALVVRLDTPGGLLSATRDAVQAELSAKVPIVFWVGPPGARAGSAGVFLTLAAHVAAMAPSSNIGAAHPVDLFGSEKPADKGESDTMAKKMENDTAAFVRGIAERRSRNIDWAEKAVRDSESITASKAVELHVVDLLAEDLPELLRKLDGRHVDLGGGDKRILHTSGAELRQATWSVKDRVLHLLGDPEVTFLIGALGVIGILLEMFHPGTIVPGVVGGICILIAAIGLQMLPVHVGALALVLLGAGFFAAELYIGGHGGFIAAGAVCVVIGSLLLIGHVDSKFYADSDFGLGWRFVTPIGLAMAAIAGSLAFRISKSAGKPLRTGAYSLVGKVGEVRELVSLEEGGLVLVAGELWKAASAKPISPGERAIVIAVRGLTLEVAPESALTKANP